MHFSTILIWLCACCSMAKSYQLGVGRADCTGPPVEIVFVSSFIVSFLLIFFFFVHSRNTQFKFEILFALTTSKQAKQQTNQIEMISQKSINK